MHFHVITLFPESYDSYLGASILKRAREDKKIRISFYNPRDFTKDKWHRVDQKPYGGGPGMVLEAEPILKAVEKVRVSAKKRSRAPRIKTIFFAPEGKQFDTTYAEKTAKRYSDVVLICGRYEGVDARVEKILKAERITIGPYVLTGGELPAMVVMDTIARRIPGVLGNSTSLEEKRVAGKDVYTRPEVLTWKGKKYRVPKVLLTGHHKNIDEWRGGKKQ